MIAVLGRGKSLKKYKKFSDLFDTVYLCNSFKKEIEYLGKKHFKNKIVIQVVGRASVQLKDSQYKKLRIKKVYTNCYDIKKFKTGSGKNLVEKFPSYVNLKEVPFYMRKRAYPWMDWKIIAKHIDNFNKQDDIISFLKKKYSDKDKDEHTFPGTWPTCGNYALDLALNQNKNIDSIYLFGLDFYKKGYLTPWKRDRNTISSKYKEKVMISHIKYLIKEFFNVNFYFSSREINIDFPNLFYI